MKAVKYLWILSLLLYLASSLYVYAGVKDNIALHLDSTGNPELFLSKQQFFYYLLTGAMLINGIFLLLANATKYLNMPFRSLWMEDARFKKAFLVGSKEWVRGFALVANLFFFVINGAVYGINTNSGFPADIFTYIVGAMAIAWLFAYFPIFRKPSI